MIRVEHLQKKFEGQSSCVFQDISTEFKEGEIVAIIGPSGTGKSLFLRSLMRLDTVDSGNIYLDDIDVLHGDAEDLVEVRKRLGMVFQHFNLFQHLSVVENVMTGLVDLQSMSKPEAFESAMKILKEVGLSDKAFYYPHSLSGGQQQRAAIARTIALNPEIILLDEPTSALDPLMKGEVESVIKMLASQGHTMIIVTHEMELVRQIATRVLFISEGVIYEEGTPEQIFDHPQRVKTRRFVQALKVLEFNVQSKDFDFIGTQTTIAEYGFKNHIPKKLIEKLQSVMEELFQMIIIQPKQNYMMHVAFEYNNKEESLHGIIKFSGPKIDPDDPMYFFSWPIICMHASEIKVSEIGEDDYSNRVDIVLHE